MATRVSQPTAQPPPIRVMPPNPIPMGNGMPAGRVPLPMTGVPPPRATVQPQASMPVRQLSAAIGPGGASAAITRATIPVDLPTVNVEGSEPTEPEVNVLEVLPPAMAKVAHLCHNHSIDPNTQIGYVILDFLIGRRLGPDANVVAELDDGQRLSLYNRSMELTDTLASRGLLRLNLIADVFINAEQEEIGVGRLLGFMEKIIAAGERLTYYEQRLMRDGQQHLERLIAINRPSLQQLSAQLVATVSGRPPRYPADVIVGGEVAGL